MPCTLEKAGEKESAREKYLCISMYSSLKNKHPHTKVETVESGVVVAGDGRGGSRKKKEN